MRWPGIFCFEQHIININYSLYKLALAVGKFPPTGQNAGKGCKMQIRTDLAVEQQELCAEKPRGVESTVTKKNGVIVDKIVVKTAEGAAALGKPVGTYITVQTPPFSRDVPTLGQVQAVAGELKAFLPFGGTVLVAGLGNTKITPDALGPKTAANIFATRHIGKELAKAAGLSKARSVAVLAPGVLGQTGIETAEIIKSVAQKIKPTAVIAVDALASRRIERLGCTVQIADSGIEPGAGVGNARNELSRKTLGVPVIAVGVPTVVDASTLIYDLIGKDDVAEPEGRKMIVTPREIDLIIARASKFLANCLNTALQPDLEPELLSQMLD